VKNLNIILLIVIGLIVIFSIAIEKGSISKSGSFVVRPSLQQSVSSGDDFGCWVGPVGPETPTQGCGDTGRAMYNCCSCCADYGSCDESANPGDECDPDSDYNQCVLNCAKTFNTRIRIHPYCQQYWGPIDTDQVGYDICDDWL